MAVNVAVGVGDDVGVYVCVGVEVKVGVGVAATRLTSNTSETAPPLQRSSASIWNAVVFGSIATSRIPAGNGFRTAHSNASA